MAFPKSVKNQHPRSGLPKAEGKRLQGLSVARDGATFSKERSRINGQT
jgi:hypothetical protein